LRQPLCQFIREHAERLNGACNTIKKKEKGLLPRS